MNSQSNLGFDLLGMVAALGILSLAALVVCLAKECKGSTSRKCSMTSSKHTS